MAREKKPEDMSSDLLERAQAQIAQLWTDCQKKFFNALDDSDRKRIDVNFSVTIDCSESMPVLDTEISFKDNAKEGGMRVTKSFRKNITEEMDPEQMPLAGTETGPGRLKDTGQNGPVEKENKPKRGRPKKERPPITTAE